MAGELFMVELSEQRTTPRLPQKKQYVISLVEFCECGGGACVWQCKSQGGHLGS